MDIYLSRHGRTVWNSEGLMQGLRNSPLTSEGIEGAIALGRELGGITPEIGYCVSSPMPRALHTAQLALSHCDYKIPLIIDPNLTEMDLGIFEGMSKTDASSLYPEAYDKFMNDPDNYVPVRGGETFRQVLIRAQKALDTVSKLSKENADRPVLVISHNIIIQALMFQAGAIDADNLRGAGPISQTTLHRITV